MHSSLTPEEERALILSVGTHAAHRPLSPVEVAELLDRAVAGGTPAAQLAEQLGFTGTSMIGRFRRLLVLPAEFRHTVDWGAGPSRLSFTQAQEVARLPRDDQRARLAERALDIGLTAAEVKQAVQLVQRGGADIDAAVDAALRMRPAIERRHLLLGAVDESLRACLGALSQAKRDELLKTVLRNLGISAPGRLGVERFTITSTEAAHAMLPPPDEVESSINAQLKSLVGASGDAR